MRRDEQLAAKIRKRLGQLARLGPKGAARTLYIKTLGRTVYSSTDIARSIARRNHRRRAYKRALDNRLEHLRRRWEEHGMRPLLPSIPDL